MNVQKYLEQVKVLDEKLQKNKERYFELRSEASSAGAIRYDKELVQSSICGSRLENIVFSYMQLEVDIPVMQRHFEEHKKHAIKLIRMLDSEDDQNVLMMKYIKYMSFNQIARCHEITRRTAINRNNECIKKLKEKIQKS